MVWPVLRGGGGTMATDGVAVADELYRKLLAEGRVKQDHNSEMYTFWSTQVTSGRTPTPRDVVAACGTTIHASRAAVGRYRAGIAPKPIPPGLAPKTVRNAHTLIHRALADVVAWKYIPDNPASRVKPPKPPRSRRTVWGPQQIQTFLRTIQHERFAALFLLELTTRIRRGQVCGLRWESADLDRARSLCTTTGSWWTCARQGRRQDHECRPDDRHRQGHRCCSAGLACGPGPRARVVRRQL